MRIFHISQAFYRHVNADSHQAEFFHVEYILFAFQTYIIPVQVTIYFEKLPHNLLNEILQRKMKTKIKESSKGKRLILCCTICLQFI